MHEYSSVLILPTSFEHRADKAIVDRDLDKSAKSLIEGIEEAYSHDPETYHRLSLKLITLPFRDFALNGASPERQTQAEHVYGWLGVLLENELTNLKSTTVASEERDRIRGRISEITFLSIVARNFKKHGNRVPVLAGADDDHAHEFATDILLLPITGDALEQVWLQSKTYWNGREQRYHELVTVVGLNQIDPHFRDPNHHESIPNYILRELSGRYDPKVTATLDNATATFNSLIAAPREI